eukprot:2980213-Rhodomonas_salina.3
MAGQNQQSGSGNAGGFGGSWMSGGAGRGSWNPMAGMMHQMMAQQMGMMAGPGSVLFMQPFGFNSCTEQPSQFANSWFMMEQQQLALASVPTPALPPPAGPPPPLQPWNMAQQPQASMTQMGAASSADALPKDTSSNPVEQSADFDPANQAKSMIEIFAKSVRDTNQTTVQMQRDQHTFMERMVQKSSDTQLQM